MKRLGLLVILALCGCQTAGDIDQVASPMPAAGDTCTQARLILGKYYLTPHQRSDLIESMRANNCTP